MFDSSNIIQWNCDGLYSHYNDFKLLMNNYNPFVICLQETKFKANHVPKLRNYKIYYNNVISETVAHGGVAIYVKEGFSSIPFNITTDLQVVAIQIFFPFKITICNLYLPPNIKVSFSSIQDLINQLEPPYIVMGDFNAHNLLWGSAQSDCRGRVIEKVILESNISLLNTGQHTHLSYSYKTFSCIDLTLVSPILINYFDWHVEEDLYSSDHFPIILSLSHNNSNVNNTRRIKWDVKKGNWDLYNKNICLDIVMNDDIDLYESNITNEIVNAAKKAIPHSSTVHRRRVPWWNAEIAQLIHERKIKLRKFKTTFAVDDFKNFVSAKYKARKLIRELQKLSWENFTSSINETTPPTIVYDKIRQMSGKYKNSEIPVLLIENQFITDQFQIAEQFSKFFASISNSNNYDTNS